MRNEISVNELYCGWPFTGNKECLSAGFEQSGIGHVELQSSGGSTTGLIGLFGNCGGKIGWVWVHGWQVIPGAQTQHLPCESVNVIVWCCANPKVARQPSTAATFVQKNIPLVIPFKFAENFHIILTKKIPHSICITSLHTFWLVLSRNETKSQLNSMGGNHRSFIPPAFSNCGSCQLRQKSIKNKQKGMF